MLHNTHNQHYIVVVVVVVPYAVAKTFDTNTQRRLWQRNKRRNISKGPGWRRRCVCDVRRAFRAFLSCGAVVARVEPTQSCNYSVHYSACACAFVRCAYSGVLVVCGWVCANVKQVQPKVRATTDDGVEFVSSATRYRFCRHIVVHVW